MKKHAMYAKAFEYSVRGYSVIPIRKNKLPILMSWKAFQKKAADEAQIEEWYKTYPEANIGIITGKISDITVVDIDTKGGKQVSLETFPKTFTVKTPTGGYHLYYKYEPEIQQTANTFPQFPNVDIRNDGGYVLAPPSVCDYVKHGERVTGAYKVEFNYPIAEFPVKLFLSESQVAAKKNSPNARAASLLKSFKAMEEGDGRNNALTKAIGKLLKIVMPQDFESVAWPIAVALNGQFKAPLEEKEVRTIFESIGGRESAKPLAGVEFLKTEKGQVIVNEENVYRTLGADEILREKFRDNTFTGVVESNFERDHWEALQRSDITGVVMYLMRTYAHFEHVPHTCVEDAIMHYVKKHRYSPASKWLSELVWDEKARLDSWLSTVYGVEDDVYHRAVGANWLKGLVKRIVQPGCKFDYVIVLEGKQGMRKSTSLSVLGGEWYVETVFTPDNKDFFMIFAGKAIVEFSEGETLSRTEAKRLKAVITMQHDKYRPPYERAAKEFPRQCVFAMTTNQEQYLKDETGNRRWLPISCVKEADIEWLRANRDQLYAEAYHRVITLKEKTYEFPEAETRMQQQMRQTTDPREEQIYDWYFKTLTKAEREDGITTRQAYVCGVQGLVAEAMTFGKEMGKMEEIIIGAILRESLFLKRSRVRGESSARFYRYFPTDDTTSIEPKDVNINSVRALDREQIGTRR